MLKVNGIDVVYMKVIQVLKGVSFEVAHGQVIALLGANGAGKTTVLKAISGILATEDGEVTHGNIEYNGMKIERKGAHEISRLGISQVMEGRRVLEHLTVEENLLIGAYHRRDKRAIQEDMEMVFDWFPRIKELRKRISGYLSGGEQQMLVIGRAIMAQPKLLLLDEPSLGLAPLVVEEIYDIIARINKEKAMSILLVEQNARAALNIADHGYILENGRIVLSGTGSILRENKDIKEFYLGLSEVGAKKDYRNIKHYRRKKGWNV